MIPVSESGTPSDGSPAAAATISDSLPLNSDNVHLPTDRHQSFIVAKPAVNVHAEPVVRIRHNTLLVFPYHARRALTLLIFCQTSLAII